MNRAMNRAHVGRSTALWLGLGGTLLLACLASLAADANKPERTDASRTQRQRLEAAQQRLERAAQEVASLSMALSEEEVADSTSPRARSQRAVLGVSIDSGDDEDREEGVQVQSVSPGGGASEAGLKSGDLLLALNDKLLKRDEEGSPRSKLLALMGTIKPGEKVSVKFSRNGKTRTAEVMAKSIAERTHAYSYAPRAGRVERFDIPPFVLGRADSILGNAELVPLTPKLGQYFGTEKGLLVVRAPSDDDLELEEGDVILEIDGRAPNNTSHAMRILSSYQPGEKLTLNVMRKKRRTNIEVVVPEKAPRARIERLERSIERSLQNLPALQEFRRGGISLAPPPSPPNPPMAALAPLPKTAPVPPTSPTPPTLQVQPLPDDEVRVRPVY
jgi:S1-C subfamily serine protease